MLEHLEYFLVGFTDQTTRTFMPIAIRIWYREVPKLEVLGTCQSRVRLQYITFAAIYKLLSASKLCTSLWDCILSMAALYICMVNKGPEGLCSKG